MTQIPSRAKTLCGLVNLAALGAELGVLPVQMWRRAQLAGLLHGNQMELKVQLQLSLVMGDLGDLGDLGDPEPCSGSDRSCTGPTCVEEAGT